MDYIYLVRGGEITSKNDEQKHFVSCKQLIELYNVNPKECLCWHDAVEWIKGRKKELLQSLIYLVPQASGIYNINSCKTFAER